MKTILKLFGSLLVVLLFIESVYGVSALLNVRSDYAAGATFTLIVFCVAVRKLKSKLCAPDGYRGCCRFRVGDSRRFGI